MVTPLRVPRRYEVGLVKIRDLSDEAYRELLSALRESPLTFSEESLSKSVNAQVSEIPSDDVVEIVLTLLSLYSLRQSSESSAPEIAERVSLGMEESGSKELKLPAESRVSFSERLTELLDLGQIDLAVRAGNLLFEHEHSFRQARIFTDVRPVFEPGKPDTPPRGAVIVHTLKISFYADNEPKDFFVALDASDISALRAQLERADMKARSLEAVLAAADVRHIDAE